MRILLKLVMLCLNKDLEICTYSNTLDLIPCFCFLYSNINYRGSDTSSFLVTLLDSRSCFYTLKIYIQQAKLLLLEFVKEKTQPIDKPEHKIFQVCLFQMVSAVGGQQY